MSLVTVSMDGFIKRFRAGDFTVDKCFFISQSGLTAAAPIEGQKCYALAGLNNEIYLWNFNSARVDLQFSAHDDYITTVLYKQV